MAEFFNLSSASFVFSIRFALTLTRGIENEEDRTTRDTLFSKIMLLSNIERDGPFFFTEIIQNGVGEHSRTVASDAVSACACVNFIRETRDYNDRRDWRVINGDNFAFPFAKRATLLRIDRID